MRQRFAFAVAVVACFALLGPGLAGGAWQPGPERFDVGRQNNLKVMTRDGVELRANVLYPVDRESGERAEGRFPVLINFTPYGKAALDGIESFPSSGMGDASGLARPLPELVRRGYINVIADIRGTGNSGGQFGLIDPIQGRDGADLVEWAADLPSSSGKVGMYGPSYMAIIQYLTAAQVGPDSPLEAMFAVAVPNDTYREFFAAGGVLAAESDVPLLGIFVGLPALWPLLDDSFADPLRAVELEISRVDAILANFVPLTVEGLTGGERSFRGDFWRERAPGSMLDSVVENGIAVMSVGGWSDVFQRGPLMNWAGLQNAAAGRAPERKPGRRLEPTPRYQVVQGPWTHLNQGANFPLAELAHRWFDRQLKGKRGTELGRGRRTVHLFDIGSRRWRDVGAYPLPKVPDRAFFLDAGPSGSGASSRNDGLLSRRAPERENGADTISWVAAANPCSGTTDQYSLGAISLALSLAGLEPPCNQDESPKQTGQGALSYTTEPFKREMTVAGPIAARLFMTSTRPETYLTATVESVDRDGDSRPLSSGALLGSFRAVDSKQSWYGRGRKPMVPHHTFNRETAAAVPVGRPFRVDIEIFPTFASIPAGERLRLTLTTADTPHVLPSLTQTARLLGGIYEIDRNRTRSSYLNVPLAPAERFATGCRICKPTGG